MARINLLPWREALRKEREQRFYLMLAVASVVTLLIMSYVHVIISGKIDGQNRRNQFLSQQIARVDLEIKEIKALEVEKGRLLQRMNVIQRLQASRPEVVHLFEELVDTLPEGAQLLSVELNGPSLNIVGIADSAALVSAFMRNLDNSTWLHNPELVVINSRTQQYPGSSWFNLKVRRTVRRSG